MMRSFALVLEFEWRSLLSSKSMLIQMLILEPIAYLALLGGGLSGLMGNSPGYLSFIYPGIVGFQIMRLFSYLTYRLTVERRWGIIAIKVVGGVSRTAYMAALLTLAISLLLLQFCVSAPVARLLGVHFTVWGVAGLLLAGVVSMIFWTSLAFLGAFAFRSYVQRDLWLTFLMLPLSLSAPVFYSLQRAPGYLQVMSRFNPLSYQVESMRALFLGEAAMGSLLLSAGMSLLLLAAASLVMGRSELLSSEA